MQTSQMEDLYQTLQVDPRAEPEVIDAAWRRLAQVYHPDGGLRPDPARMSAINRAHQVLRDPRQRAEYDQRRPQPPSGPPPVDERPGPPPVSAAPGPPPVAVRPKHERGWGAQAPAGCWRHHTRAVARCASCGALLCGDCAARWRPPHCDRCVLSQGRKEQVRILWPAAAVAAWLVLIVVAFTAAWGSLFSVPPGWRPPFWPTLLVTYLLGAGAVGGLDLLVRLLPALPRDIRRRLNQGPGAIAFLLLFPLAIVAGAVFAPVRGTMGTVAFLRGRARVRSARAALRSGG